jgi:hypothetical protein
MNKGTERSEKKANLEDDIDSLFKLPLSEFIGARNELAARLKKDGHADDASLIKTLAKPSISAWAVNQLYWDHREAFDRLLVASQRSRQAQSSHTGGRIADLRESLESRGQALSDLLDLATILLRDGGHNPAPDTIHRITTTLEALSAYATHGDGPTPGRLTQDVDPPGFGSLASFISGTGTTARNDESRKITPSQKSVGASAKSGQTSSRAGDAGKAPQPEETRRARIAAAKLSLQEAKKSLSDARSKAQSLDAAQKKAHAEAKASDAEARQAEKKLREAEDRFKKASVASQEAANQAQRMAAETQEATRAVEGAKRTIEQASKELESLLRESK